MPSEKLPPAAGGCRQPYSRAAAVCAVSRADVRQQCDGRLRRVQHRRQPARVCRRRPRSGRRCGRRAVKGRRSRAHLYRCAAARQHHRRRDAGAGRSGGRPSESQGGNQGGAEHAAQSRRNPSRAGAACRRLQTRCRRIGAGGIAGVCRSGGIRAAQSAGVFHRQRVGRTRPAAFRRPDLRRQPLPAFGVVAVAGDGGGGRRHHSRRFGADRSIAQRCRAAVRRRHHQRRRVGGRGRLSEAGR